MMLFDYINNNIERIRKEVRAGIAPCSVLRHWEIYANYDAFKKMGHSETISRFNSAEKFRLSEMTICRIIKKMESNVESIDN